MDAIESKLLRNTGRQFRPAPPGTHITIRGLNKQFGGATLYADFDLNLPRGKVTCIFGPNGCGKSTLMNMIAGLVETDSGQILFDGKELKDTRIGYVFQNYREALFPWIRAIDNIKYPLRLAGMSAGECQARADALIETFDIGFDLTRYPYELSGGQQQLVSILRALAPKPEVLFLDEPFSALDYEMTLLIRDKLQEMFSAMSLTTVIVSHDLEEAVYLADEILLLTKRPTNVADVLAYDAPRPRDLSTLSDPDFISVKADCLRIFQREVRK